MADKALMEPSRPPLCRSSAATKQSIDTALAYRAAAHDLARPDPAAVKSTKTTYNYYWLSSPTKLRSQERRMVVVDVVAAAASEKKVSGLRSGREDLTGEKIAFFIFRNFLRGSDPNSNTLLKGKPTKYGGRSCPWPLHCIKKYTSASSHSRRFFSTFNLPYFIGFPKKFTYLQYIIK